MNKEEEVKEAEVKETEVKETEVKEAEVKEAEVKEAEVKETEVKEAEVKETEVKETKNSGGDTVTLGGGIELSGFKAVDFGTMVVVKKIVGSYTRKFSDGNKDFEKISVVLDGKKITAELTVGGKAKTSKVEEDNLFVALDKVLKGLE
ncbi:hypothetical protein ISS04_02330 [Candidatus Woesearchaeota archaeon]|nr:hypothetical protein [Candidatus Woesearchaeota archaeon]